LAVSTVLATSCLTKPSQYPEPDVDAASPMSDAPTVVEAGVAVSDASAQPSPPPASSSDARSTPDAPSVTVDAPLDAAPPDSPVDVAAAPSVSWELVSLGPGGVPANGPSEYPMLSGTGRYVVFSSKASNLVPGDTNNLGDLFRFDRQTKAMIRVNVANNGAESDGSTYGAAVSDDGRFVLFTSLGSTLVPGDTNGIFDAFVRDVDLGLTTRVSLSATNSEIRGQSNAVAMSADGRHVVFLSSADDVIPGLRTRTVQVFLRDVRMGTVTRITTDAVAANFDAWISPTGNAVAWLGVDATGVEPEGIFMIHDVAKKTSAPVARAGSESGVNGSFSGDGRYFVFDGSRDPGTDSIGPSGVFLLDRSSGQILRVSVAAGGLLPNGEANDPHLSADGQTIAFNSNAKNLGEGGTGRWEPRIFNRAAGNFVRLPTGDRGSFALGFSADGKVIAITSSSTNLTSANTGGFQSIFVTSVPMTP
jgi:TolB protein